MNKGLEQIKAVYEDGFAEINGRRYEFLKTTHTLRVEVFAFVTEIQKQLEVGNLGFLSTPKYKHIEKLINGVVMVDGMTLSKKPNHWEEYSEDYVLFVTTALMVISYPFLQGVGINSQSQSEQS